ncbi:MAG: hypothetical protein MR270_07975, partial [Erysipelotrichaceae bacterium]|nr:hypothetical protein [Erysipelotrichaceae bacterium]
SDKYYALKNNAHSGSTDSKEIVMDEYGISSSSIDSNIVWKVGLGSNENTYTLYNETINSYLSLNNKNVENIEFTNTPSEFSLFTNGSQSYIGINDRVLIYRTTTGFYKHYGISNLAKSTYANELYVYVKSTTTVDYYENVNGRIKFAVDDNISSLFNNETFTFGIEVSSGNKTKNYIIDNNEQPYTIYHEDNKYYVVIEIGDFINNIDRSNTIFTVKAFVTYNEETYYSTISKSYSIITMIEKYLADYPSSDFIPTLTSLYNVLTK